MVILVVFYCGGYFIGTSLIPTQTKKVNPSSKRNQEIKYEGKDKTLAHLMDRINIGLDCWSIETFTNDKKVTSADLSSEKIFEVVAFSHYYEKDATEFTLDDFKNTANHYFKEGYTFDPNAIDYVNSPKCFPYKYSASEEKYTKVDTACGGTCGPNRTQYKIMNGIEKDNTLRVFVKVLFGSQAEDVKFYSDYARTKFVTDDYEKLDDYFDKGNEYLFIFEKVDGYYVFASSELV
jgi:hypothetical protein